MLKANSLFKGRMVMTGASTSGRLESPVRHVIATYPIHHSVGFSSPSLAWIQGASNRGYTLEVMIHHTSVFAEQRSSRRQEPSWSITVPATRLTQSQLECS